MGPEEAMKMLRVLEHLSCADRLGELGLFHPGEEKAMGRPCSSLQYLKGAYKKEAEGAFVLAC